MIGEMLVVGGTLVGCMGCWVAVARHKLSTELQKHKITTDYEYTKPLPEPLPPQPPKPEPGPQQQALTELLARRRTLEANITKLRDQACQYSQYEEKKYAMWRADTLKALEDARTEQQELVLEEAGLLEMMQEAKKHVKEPVRLDAPEKPIRVDSGGSVAQRVEDPGQLHDVELHDEETGRESIA